MYRLTGETIAIVTDEDGIQLIGGKQHREEKEAIEEALNWMGTDGPDRAIVHIEKDIIIERED